MKVYVYTYDQRKTMVAKITALGHVPNVLKDHLNKYGIIKGQLVGNNPYKPLFHVTKKMKDLKEYDVYFKKVDEYDMELKRVKDERR